MADQIVITEKTSQAKDVRAAVGSRYGEVLPAEGHLFDLLEPEDVVAAWKRWSPILLRLEGLYGTLGGHALKNNLPRLRDKTHSTARHSGSVSPHPQNRADDFIATLGSASGPADLLNTLI